MDNWRKAENRPQPDELPFEEAFIYNGERVEPVLQHLEGDYVLVYDNLGIRLSSAYKLEEAHFEELKDKYETPRAVWANLENNWRNDQNVTKVADNKDLEDLKYTEYVDGGVEIRDEDNLLEGWIAADNPSEVNR